MKYNEDQFKLISDMDISHIEFEKIRDVYNGIEDIIFFSELDHTTYSKLLTYLNASEDMPYGTQKARDGDPDEWVYDRLESWHDEELKIL